MCKIEREKKFEKFAMMCKMGKGVQIVQNCAKCAKLYKCSNVQNCAKMCRADRYYRANRAKRDTKVEDGITYSLTFWLTGLTCRDVSASKNVHMSSYKLHFRCGGQSIQRLLFPHKSSWPMARPKLKLYSQVTIRLKLNRKKIMLKYKIFLLFGLIQNQIRPRASRF